MGFEALLAVLLTEGHIVAALEFIAIIYLLKRNGEIVDDFKESLQNVVHEQMENMKETTSVMTRVVTLVEIIKDLTLSQQQEMSRKEHNNG